MLPPTCLTPATIALFDDDNSTVEMLRDFLEGEGFRWFAVRRRPNSIRQPSQVPTW
jgi:DNA-binding response OmpR family regulator